jgi:hypothetical protein
MAHRGSIVRPLAGASRRYVEAGATAGWRCALVFGDRLLALRVGMWRRVRPLAGAARWYLGDRLLALRVGIG